MVAKVMEAEGTNLHPHLYRQLPSSPWGLGSPKIPPAVLLVQHLLCISQRRGQCCLCLPRHPSCLDCVRGPRT